MSTEIKKIERDSETGLVNGIKYPLTEEGLIDWRNLVPLKFLYVNPTNKQKMEEKYGKPYSKIDIEKDKVADSDLVILLSGIKYLLRLRGYNSVYYSISESSENYASVKCEIEFIPNFETEGRCIVFSDCACASHSTTTGFGKNYLLECATNRAFCRVVRNFLNINVVSKEEISSNLNSENEEVVESPNLNATLYSKIEELLKKKGKTLDDVKKKFFDGQTIEIKTVKDLPSSSLVSIIEKLKTIKDKTV